MDNDPCHSEHYSADYGYHLEMYTNIYFVVNSDKIDNLRSPRILPAVEELMVRKIYAL